MVYSGMLCTKVEIPCKKVTTGASLPSVSVS